MLCQVYEIHDLTEKFYFNLHWYKLHNVHIVSSVLQLIGTTTYVLHTTYRQVQIISKYQGKAIKTELITLVKKLPLQSPEHSFS